jgi:two-component system sensor histidine kinase TctE
LQEAVSNSLDNAFKYVVLKNTSTNGGRPRVRVRLRSNEAPLPPGVTIVIDDNGPGINDADRDAVFARGFRGSAATTSDIQGSGLGLDIARSLVERMGGTVRILSKREAARLGCLTGTAMKIVLFRNPTLTSS